MAIKISQGFQRTSANPVDMDLTLTKAQMKTVNDNLMPSKYFTICQDDGKLYLYDKSNTVDSTTGKFRIQDGAEYELVEQQQAESGYVKTYYLSRDGVQAGVKINIPKDLVIESGEVKTVTVADEPYEGAEVGDKYIDLVLNDANEDHIYIPVKDLVDIYTAGNGIDINNNAVSIKIYTTNANGLSATSNGLELALATTSTSGAMSSTDKTKLDGVATGAQVNAIEVIKVNTVVQTITNKTVDITVPTKTSDLTNDSGFITKSVNDLDNYTLTSALSSVATSGDYDDLNNVSVINLYENTTISLGGIFKVCTDDIDISFRGASYSLTHAKYGTLIVFNSDEGGVIIAPDKVYKFEMMGDAVEYLEANTTITGATKCKITYDSKGLVTAGADLSASDIPDLSATYIATTEKGSNNGVAELDANGKVPSSQLPSYVDDVIEGYYYNGAFYEEAAHTTEITPETGKIYVDLSTNKSYRWGGSVYVEIAQAEIHKYVGTITGDGTATSFTITHSLNSRDVVVNIYDGTTYEDVIVDVVRTSTSAITVSFAVAPANAKTYKVVVVA